MEQFENIILKTRPDGRVVRVKDIGRVELGAKNQDVNVMFDGKETVFLADLSIARRQRAGHLRPRGRPR